MPGIWLGDIAQELDRTELHLREAPARITEKLAPVGAGTVVEPAHKCSETVPRRGVEIASENTLHLGDSLRLVEQREHREMRQVMAEFVHDLGL